MHTRKKTILTIEPADPSRAGIAAVLGQRGHDVFESHDGTHAVEILRVMVVDVIIGAVDLPQLDAIELTRRIRRMPRYGDVPIILLGSRSDPEAKTRALDAGATVWVDGPASRERLRDAIAHALSVTARRWQHAGMAALA